VLLQKYDFKVNADCTLPFSGWNGIFNKKGTKPSVFWQ